MPTGEPPQKIKGNAPMYLPYKVVWKKYKYVFKNMLKQNNKNIKTKETKRATAKANKQKGQGKEKVRTWAKNTHMPLGIKHIKCK